MCHGDPGIEIALFMNSSVPGNADIYGVASNRTEETIIRFLDHFLPVRTESADAYEVPQYSQSPHTVFTEVIELIRHCCTLLSEVHAIYWRSQEINEHAMVFFLADGGLILGISTPFGNHQRVKCAATELAQHLGTEELIITYEDLPPASVQEFHTHFQALAPHPQEKFRRSWIGTPVKTQNPR